MWVNVLLHSFPYSGGEGSITPALALRKSGVSLLLLRFDGLFQPRQGQGADRVIGCQRLTEGCMRRGRSWFDGSGYVRATVAILPDLETGNPIRYSIP